MMILYLPPVNPIYIPRRKKIYQKKIYQTENKLSDQRSLHQVRTLTDSLDTTAALGVVPGGRGGSA
jgi:hypothetical protein